jgi:hypothetical protein
LLWQVAVTPTARSPDWVSARAADELQMINRQLPGQRFTVVEPAVASLVLTAKSDSALGEVGGPTGKGSSRGVG